MGCWTPLACSVKKLSSVLAVRQASEQDAGFLLIKCAVEMQGRALSSS